MAINKAKVQRVETFIKNLSFSKGEWAGQSFKLMKWQMDKIIRPAFGTLKKDGTRQYRFVYVEIPKKTAKQN